MRTLSVAKPRDDAASDRLLELANEAYAGCRVASLALSQDVLALRGSDDPIDVVRNTVLLMQSAAHLAATAKAAAERLRPAIVREMEAARCGSILLSEGQTAV